MPRIALLLVFASGLAWAQAGGSFEIRGTVKELGADGTASLPVEGAEISLMEFVPVNGETTRKPLATAFTDRLGSFAFHPDHTGNYYVEEKKDGDTLPRGLSATLDQTHSLVQIAFTFSRPGSVSGRVVDENGQPVAGKTAAVAPAGVEFAGGMPSPGRSAVTGPDGIFTVTGVKPGAYSVLILPPAAERQKIEPQFSTKDFDVVDQDIEISYWPGGSARPAASVPVSPGVDSAVGEMKMSTASSYRVHISLPHIECAPNEKLGLRVLREGQGSMDRLRPNYPCEADFLVTHLRPGTYSVMVNREAPTSQWASASVEISNKNLEVEFNLQGEMELRGRVVATEGASLPPFNSLQVHASSEGVPPGKPVAPDGEGKFILTNLKFPHHDITVQGLGEKYYVKEIRLNGATLPDATAMLSSPSNQVEIVIDDQPGTISGTVMDGNNPAVEALVELYPKVPQVLGSTGTERDLTTARSDAQGRFQIKGLVPGEYRIVAQLAPVRGEPGLNLEARKQIAASAQAIRVERGRTADVTLPLTDPSK